MEQEYFPVGYVSIAAVADSPCPHPEAEIPLLGAETPLGAETLLEGTWDQTGTLLSLADSKNYRFRISQRAAPEVGARTYDLTNFMSKNAWKWRNLNRGDTFWTVCESINAKWPRIWLQLRSFAWLKCKTLQKPQYISKQECIPVGCVLTAAVADTRCQ